MPIAFIDSTRKSYIYTVPCLFCFFIAQHIKGARLLGLKANISIDISIFLEKNKDASKT